MLRGGLQEVPTPGVAPGALSNTVDTGREAALIDQSFMPGGDGPASPIRRAIDADMPLHGYEEGLGNPAQAAGKEGVGGESLKNKQISRLKKNKEQGSNFEKAQKEILINVKGELNVEEQITVITESGVKTRIDFFSAHPETGDIILSEFKSSASAPLTRNQRRAFPEIRATGATVVGKGKGIYTKGLKVPPAEVRIIRPDSE